ncbi:MAG: branched chain amino acid aminotransferase [Spirochaeta sp. LUC14_002_19_P3]|nr:MAG: branched chain amino acid aminotransferase [Spirochaeta sp. LUC14_002_19_P3]
MPFKLSIYPWVHCCRCNDNQWKGEFIEHEHCSPEEEARLGAEDDLLTRRNHIPGVPMVNFTSQYGLGCFEGLKAYPQKDGTLKLFRPERNCARMAVSMRGLRMPPIPEDLLLETIFEIVRRNKVLGFAPEYDAAWEKDIWQNAATVYVRPFAISEPGIGVNLSVTPWVITICTTVSAYFRLGENNAVVSKRIRATPGGTGWIKTAANYVTSTLAKAEALDEGYMEAIFLDCTTGKNIEEGSSCNFFAVLKDGTVVTPELHDTILPGITRDSVMVLARDMGMKTQERDLSLEEVFDDASECFVTGTAAGVTPLSSITREGKTKRFASLEADSVSNRFLKQLKGIQFGALSDKHGWMRDV